MGLSLTSIPFLGKSITSENDFFSNRPLEKNRTYQSDAVEETISFIKSKIKNKELSWMFENCYPNTIDTTVDYEIIDGKPDTFIITGDIDAMWLRDSTAQVWPYLPLIKKVAQTGKPVILSTGLATKNEIEEAVETLKIGDVKNLHY